MNTSSGPSHSNLTNNLESISQYSNTKSNKPNQSEISIDIHVKHLKLKVHDKTPLRVVWSRGKKSAKTQVKILSASLDKAVFDEKFQINTILELDPDTGMPAKEKVSKLTVTLDKSMGGTEIGEIEFNMADFSFGEYKITRLNLVKCQNNDVIDFEPSEAYLDIGLKGTKNSGMLYKRSSTQKSIQHPQNPVGLQLSSNTGSSSLLAPSIPGQDSNIIHMQEIEKYKKEMRLQKREHDKMMGQKNTKINNLLTELQNTQTDLTYSKNEKQKIVEQNEQLNSNLISQENLLSHSQLESEKLKNDVNKSKNQLVIEDKNIRQLQQNNQQLMEENETLVNRIKQLESSQLTMNCETNYNFNRFNTNFIPDVAVYLLNKNK